MHEMRCYLHCCGHRRGWHPLCTEVGTFVASATVNMNTKAQDITVAGDLTHSTTKHSNITRDVAPGPPLYMTKVFVVWLSGTVAAKSRYGLYVPCGFGGTVVEVAIVAKLNRTTAE